MEYGTAYFKKGGAIMTLLQEEAVQMIHGMSDDNVGFLIEVIRRLTLQKDHAGETNLSPNEKERKMQAFGKLDAARAEIKKYLPEGFDPDKELEEARAERYGSIG